MSLEELVRSSIGRAAIVRVRNALNPLLWLTATATPVCLLFAWLLGNDPFMRYGLTALASAPVIVAIGAYIYFMLTNPDRLQSEEFVTRQRELTIIERKRASPIEIESDITVDVVQIRSQLINGDDAK